ncbi:MAG: hypothetical protein Q7R85_01540 [bacterium]|nr:hypothetical protein [bacterium]
MLLIRNANIIDGTGKPSYKGDIFVAGDKVSAIGAFPNKKADVVIDALGLTVTPGFIDVNNDSDHHLALLTHPSQDDFLKQGITTIIGGHCGSSLAPLLYGSLESIRKWANPDLINVNWHWVSEFFRTIEKQGIGVNFGTLVGHSTIRRAIIGEDHRDLTDKELNVAEHVVERSLKEGALGLSTGLGYAHAVLTPYAEIRALVKIVARYNGVYSTHLRDEQSGVEASVAETIRLAEETKARTLISHLRPLIGFEPQVARAVKTIHALPDTVDLHFDLYPFGTSYVPVYTLLPAWAKRGNLESMLGTVNAAMHRGKLREGLVPVALEHIVIAKSPGSDYLVGKTLGGFAASREMDVRDALFELMTMTRMRAVVLIDNINKGIAERMVFEPRAFVATNSASLPPGNSALEPERAKETFTRFLELARIMPPSLFERAIEKITAIPAKTFRLTGRGIIKQGSYADLVCLDGANVAHTILNGRLAVKDGAVTPALLGRVLRRG